MMTAKLPKLEIVDKRIFLGGRELETVTEFQIKSSAEKTELSITLLVELAHKDTESYRPPYSRRRIRT